MTTMTLVTGTPGQLAGLGVLALGTAWAARQLVHLARVPAAGSHHRAPLRTPLRRRLALTWYLACIRVLTLLTPRQRATPSRLPAARPAAPGRAPRTAPSPGGGGAVRHRTAQQLADHEQRRDWGHDDPAGILPRTRVCPAALSHLVAQAEEAA